jgi:hypothetical protein
VPAIGGLPIGGFGDPDVIHLDVGTGVFNIALRDAALARGTVIFFGVPTGRFSITGANATIRSFFTMSPATGAFNTASPGVTETELSTLNAGVGAFALLMRAAPLIKSSTVSPATGVFTLVENPASVGPSIGNTLVAGVGAFAIASPGITFGGVRQIAAATATFTLNGVDATLQKNGTLQAAPGAFAVAGQPANLNNPQSVLQVDTGRFFLAGQATGLTKSGVLQVDVGAFALTGNDADLTRFVGRLADTGVFTLAGSGASIGFPLRTLIAAPGTFALASPGATLVRAQQLLAGTGAFALAGQNATLSTDSFIADVGPPLTFSLASFGAALVSGLTFTEPHRSRDMFANVREQTSLPYATADDAYNAWCAVLSVSYVDTETPAAPTLAAINILETKFAPVPSAPASKVMLGHGAGLMLFSDVVDPDETGYRYNPFSYAAGGAEILNWTGPNSSNVMSLVLAAQWSNHAIASQNYNLKIHHGMNLVAPVPETIMIFTSAKAGGDPTVNPIRVAIRLRPGYFEWYVTALSGDVPAGQHIEMAYIIGDFSTNSPTDGGFLASAFTGTKSFVSDTTSPETRSEFATTSVVTSFLGRGAGSYEFVDAIMMLDVADALPVWNVFDTLNVHHDVIAKWLLNLYAADVIKVKDPTNPNMIYGDQFADAALLVEKSFWTLIGLLNEGMTLADAMDATRAWLVIDKLFVQQSDNATALYGVLLQQNLRFVDGMFNFFGGDLGDGILFEAALAPLWQPTAHMAEGIVIQEFLENHLLFRVDMADTIDITFEQLTSMFFAGVIADGFDVSGAYLLPGGSPLAGDHNTSSFTTWAINTRTQSISEYTNYQFNSFARAGRKFIASKADGLYELEGADDDGAEVLWRIRNGLSQFNGSKLNGFKAAYIGMRGEGDIMLKIILGNGREAHYKVRAKDMQTTKINIGKGLSSRYFSFELSGTQEMDLDAVEFVPLAMNRRT